MAAEIALVKPISKFSSTPKFGNPRTLSKFTTIKMSATAQPRPTHLSQVRKLGKQPSKRPFGRQDFILLILMKWRPFSTQRSTRT
uniref:Magnesium-protoporphyrin IX monomethyl ester oxidative cyclase n=1 Tax=Rhizophora mucronata TaxID=61149 RepID=A0A2P2L4U7_RHIMU